MSTANMDDFSITLGVEEELFLVDPVSRDLLTDPKEGIFDLCDETAPPHKVVRELLRAQIETNTKVCSSVQEVRESLLETRRVVIEATEKFGASPLAASTHPIAHWQDLKITPKERYEHFTMVFQEGVRRFVIGGMHVHAGFGDPDTRIQVMTAIRRYLPLLHALSTSSPFNAGRDTGFRSYRLSLVGGIPRTGIPNPMYSWDEYELLLTQYKNRNFIENGSELWWDIRPSHAYPTVEMRICDVCTRLEDAVSITALYACLIRMLVRRLREGNLPEEPLNELIAEDRWIAQRYGVLSFFGDTSTGIERIDIDDYATALIEVLQEDAEALSCEQELHHVMTIIREGTSSDRQIDLYRLRLLEGDSPQEALKQVVDQILAETKQGVTS